MKNFLLFILFFLQLSAVHDGQDLSGTDPVNELHSDILYSILSLRFEKADSMLKLSAGVSEGDAYFCYLQNYLEFSDAMISGDRIRYETYLENAGQRIESIRKAGRNDPGSAIHLSSIHLQSSILCAYHGEIFHAARYFYNARHFLRQSELKGGVSAMNFRNRGLITLGVGSVPGEYRWLLKIFGIEGEMQEGLGYIEEYHSFSSGSGRTEACLIHRFAALFVNSPDGGPGGMQGCRNDSLTLFRYARALKDLASGNSRKVVRNLSGYRQEKQERAFPYLYLLLGEAKLNGLETDARIPLERFLRDHTGEHYRHYAWHRLSWYYLLSGDSSKYRQARQQVLDSGEAYLDADRQSLSEASDTLPVNTLLLKARLLFDGGYYKEALEQMNNITGVDLLNRRDSVDYIYRMGRVYDRLENTEKALAYYSRVLAAGSGEEWYYAPSAALHSGRIYEGDGNTEKALESYRECLKINRSAYKKSIDYKARQGIRRLDR